MQTQMPLVSLTFAHVASRMASSFLSLSRSDCCNSPTVNLPAHKRTHTHAFTHIPRRRTDTPCLAARLGHQLEVMWPLICLTGQQSSNRPPARDKVCIQINKPRSWPRSLEPAIHSPASALPSRDSRHDNVMMICLPLDWFLLNLGSVVSDAAALSATVRAVRFDMGSRSELQGWPSLDCLLLDPFGRRISILYTDTYSFLTMWLRVPGLTGGTRMTTWLSYHEPIKVMSRPGRSIDI